MTLKRWKLYLLAIACLGAVGSPFSLLAQKIYVAPEPYVLMYNVPEMQEMVKAALDSVRNQILFEQFLFHHYAREKVEFDNEMLLREKYLLGLLNGNLKELRNRRKGFISAGVIDQLTSAEDLGLDLENPHDYDLQDLSLPDCFLLTSNYDRQEYHKKLIIAEAVKAELIQNNSLDAVKRMFDYDYTLAAQAYQADDYGLAILCFNHLLTAYPYKNYDDILYYRAESEYASGYYISAAASYNRLIDEFPESVYLPDAVTRLLYIYPVLERYDAHKALWEKYKDYQFDFADIFELDARKKEIADTLNLEKLDPTRRLNLEYERDKIEVKIKEKAEYFDFASRFFYNAQLGLYLGGNYAEMHEAFTRLPRISPNRLKGAFLDGDGLMKLLRFKEAIKPLQLVAETKFKLQSPECQLGEAAKIELGYCLYALNRPAEGRDVFLTVRKDSPRYRDALLGQAWTEYKLNNFAKVDSLTRFLQDNYPNDPVTFEASALSSFNLELLGRTIDAISQYNQILNLINTMSAIQVHVAERRVLEQRLEDLRAMETSVAVKRDPKVFKVYQAAKAKLERLYLASKLSETAELNENLRQLLIERDSLTLVIESYQALQDTVEKSKNPTLQSSYTKLGGKLEELSAILRDFTYQEGSRTTAVQKWVQQQYRQEIQDTLLTRLENEMLYTNQLVSAIPGVGQDAGDYRSRGDWLSHGLTQDEVVFTRQKKEAQFVALSENRMIEVSEDINKWRDYVYKQESIAELNFDYLVDQMELIQSLTDHINTLQQMIELKEAEMAQRLQQVAGETAVAGNKGEKTIESAPDESEIQPEKQQPEMENLGDILIEEEQADTSKTGEK